MGGSYIKVLQGQGACSLIYPLLRIQTPGLSYLDLEDQWQVPPS